MWNLINNTNESIYIIERFSQIEKTNLWLLVGKRRRQGSIGAQD